MSSETVREYKATTGEEAIDLILNEFHKRLVNSGIFPLHRVWHEFEIQGGVRVKGWSTKTEEVKFVVTLEGPAKGGVLLSEHETTEEISERVDVKIAPQPPDILRDSLPEFPCPNCGRIFHSKPSMTSHWKIWCKAEPVPPDSTRLRAVGIDGEKEIAAIKKESVLPDPTSVGGPSYGTTDRHATTELLGDAKDELSIRADSGNLPASNEGQSKPDKNLNAG